MPKTHKFKYSHDIKQSTISPAQYEIKREYEHGEHGTSMKN